MAASYTDQYLEQGTTFTNQLTLTDSYGNPYNLTAFTINSQAKKSYISSNVAFQFTATVANAVTRVLEGQVYVSPGVTNITTAYGTDA